MFIHFNVIPNPYNFRIEDMKLKEDAKASQKVVNVTHAQYAKSSQLISRFWLGTAYQRIYLDISPMACSLEKINH